MSDQIFQTSSGEAAFTAVVHGLGVRAQQVWA